MGREGGFLSVPLKKTRQRVDFLLVLTFPATVLHGRNQNGPIQRRIETINSHCPTYHFRAAFRSLYYSHIVRHIPK